MKRLYKIKINMRLSLIIKTLLLLVLFCNNAFSQGTPSAMGKEFWVAFGRALPSVSTPGLQIRIVATKTTNVTFSFTDNNSFNQTITVNAGEVYTHRFSLQEIPLISSSNEHHLPATKSKKTLYITSDEDISVYVSDFYRASTDATNILPTNAYGTSYYSTEYHIGEYNGPFFVANEDGTEIRADGVLITTLDRGELFGYHNNVANIPSTSQPNPWYNPTTPSRPSINYTSNKPFATFAAHSVLRVVAPAGDHAYQQLSPVSAWGKTFFVPVTHRGIERIRVIVSQDGTNISQTGGTVVTDNPQILIHNLSSPIGAGKVVEIEARLVNGGCYITADKPIAVLSFMVGGQTPGIADSTLGDPAMVWIPPIEQSITYAGVAAFFARENTSVLRDDKHYLMITTPTATKNDTRMKIGATGTSQPIPSGLWRDNPASGYSYCIYNFPSTATNDAYLLENPHGFLAYVYGLGLYESYHYVAASSVRNLEASFYINDIQYQSANGQLFCGGSFNIRGEIGISLNVAPGHLRWYINGNEQTSARDNLQWSIPSLPAGTHTIKMTALTIGNETVEVESTITIAGTMNAGTIGSSQSIASGAMPTAFTSTPATGGGTITYQWQSSPDNATWTDISGATSATYAPDALIATTYYRRVATGTCGTAETASILITVGATADMITVTGNSGSICSGNAVTLSATASAVTSPVFRWYSAATGGSLLHTGATFTPSPNLTTTTTYHVSVSGTSQAEGTRKAVTVTVAAALSAGTINNTSTSVASGTAPNAFTSTAATGGVGTIAYQWQSSPDNSTWANVPGATSATYAPGPLTATTYYRRAATNTCGTVHTTSVLITVSGTADMITVTGNSSSICSGDAVTLSATASTDRKSVV